MRELFICFGTQFEANMMERSRWIRKLQDPDTRFVVVDPIPDPFSVEHADLIIPSPPHPATTKLYQNGEWKLSLAVPQKQAPKETRSDPTIIYDAMAEISRRLDTDAAVAKAHPDLARHARSGYLRTRFVAPEETEPATGPFSRSYATPGLLRLEGEVSRPQLWNRILDYTSSGSGPLYCRPEHPDGSAIQWEELLEKGAIIYGGVGTTRYRLDYDQPDRSPFGDIYRRPRPFTFFVPTKEDLDFPKGIILNSGRSSLSDERERILFATSTFNSGKATPAVNMPDDNPLHVSGLLAERYGLKTGDFVRIKSRLTGESLVVPVVVSDRVKGESVYVSFHKSRAQIEKGQYINTVTSHLGRCSYCGQTRVKVSEILLERVGAPTSKAPSSAVTTIIRRAAELLQRPPSPVDTTLIDPKAELPVWQGQTTRLHVTDIIRETSDVYTFRFQGDPLVRFVYWPGQFCTLVLNIDGKKVVRSCTISSTPTRPYILEITIKRVPGGLVSNWLPDNLRLGDSVEIAGPKGKFCLTPGKIPHKILFVAGGSGITPLMAMTRWLCDVSANHVDVKFFNSVRTPDDIIFKKEIELLTSRYKMFEPIIVTASRGANGTWQGLTGHVSRDILEKMVPDIHDRHVFMCGPEGFMVAVKDILKGMNFDQAKLHLESFGGTRTSSENKSTPSSPLHPSVAPVTRQHQEVAPAAGALKIAFARSGKQVMSDGQMPLLDLAEAHDIDLDYGCRSGSCGDCKVRVLKGDVAQEVDDGLTPAEKDAGYILSCVGKPVTDCTLDA